ncbi:hypothetical protein SAMN05421803_107178 [Nocardiopsis flavescens]|uniref:Uncharacterized protein n=1 Tax=Nocardiopsis flavescens TaxID=758803 RepID=A0A1M6KHQ3_9ACTN|nr:hypothetical protein SAMN05421803_107178 [Nocardiopsis flavescens]
MLDVKNETLAKVCACGAYSYLIPQKPGPGGESIWRRVTTGCLATTRATYAQGHDAKLKGFLIEAGVGGHQVLWTGDGTVIGRTAEGWAAELGWLDAVREGIERKRAR